MGIIINGQNDTIGPVDNSMSLLGTVSIGGTMTIEDFTNIDSVGLGTFRNGLHVTGGNVAVGHNNPQYSLDLGESSSTIRLISENNGTAIRVGAGGNNDVTLLRVDGNNPGAIHGESDSANYGFSLKYMGSRNGNNNSLSIFSDNQVGTQVEAVTILQDGKIGINDTNPTSYANSQATLVIKDDTNPALCINDTGQTRDWWFIGQGDGLAVKYADGGGSNAASNVTDSMFFKNNGQIQVNATSESIGGKVVIKHNVNYNTTDFDDDPTLYLLNGDQTTGVSEAAIVLAGRNTGGSTFRAAISGNGSTGLKFYTTSNTESDDTPAMIINGSGNIGINDTNPLRRLSINNGTTDSDIIEMYNDEVGINFGAWGTGSSYPREATINGTRFDSGSSPFLRIGGQGGIKFCVDLNSEKLRIESGGGLKFTGQGTSIPVAGILHHTNNNLYVRGGTVGLILSNQDNTNTIHISESNHIKFETTDGTERLRITSDGTLRQTLTTNNLTESHWYNHTSNGYIIQYDNNDVLTLTKNVNTANYDTICYRRITMSKNCDIEFDLKGNSPTTVHRHVGFVINGDGGSNYSNMDRLVFRYRPGNTSQNLIRLDAGGGGTTFTQSSSSIPNFFDGTYRHILIQIRDRTFRIYSDGVLVNSYRASTDLVRSSGWFGLSIYEASTSGSPTISLKNFSIRNHIIKPNFLVKATGVNVDVSAGNNLPFNAIQHDRDGNYNNSSYYFTAPVHGLYYFFVNAYRNSSNGTRISLYKNNTEVLICRPVPNGGDFVYHTSGMILLEKGDNVSVVAADNFDNFYGNNDQRFSSFGGYLVD